MTLARPLTATLIALTVTACVATPADPLEHGDAAMLWVQNAAEYQAVTTQIYAQATRDLQTFIADASWTAMPGHKGDPRKPAAIILDVDETVTSNADFQINHLPYTSLKHYVWNRDNKAVAVPGVVNFVRAAKAANIEVFYVTNRRCAPVAGDTGNCPQEQVTIDDIREIGIRVDADHVLLASERPGWTKEKLSRREHVAETHRVIMLFGDDFGDFVFCAREKPAAPCTVSATRESRHAALRTHDKYWGNGWYILPNPMHGSWTTVR